MKTFDLNAYGVVEMNRQEMLIVDGGNIFVDAWNAICSAAKAVGAAAQAIWDWLCGAAGTLIHTLDNIKIDFTILPSGFTISC